MFSNPSPLSCFYPNNYERSAYFLFNSPEVIAKVQEPSFPDLIGESGSSLKTATSEFRLSPE
jgi:hypothetical protein